MSKIYSFEFPGNKEMFLNELSKFPNNNHRFYYFDNYIVEISDDEIRFGVARGGHSGGYWFVPMITEIDNKTTFCGRIHHFASYTNVKEKDKIIYKIGELILFIILLPVLLTIRIFYLCARSVRKLFKRAKPKEETLEDRLYVLMENHLNCIRK